MKLVSGGAAIVGAAVFIAGCGGTSQPTPRQADALLMSGSNYRSVNCKKAHSGSGLNCVIVGGHSGRESCSETFYIKNGRTSIEGACFGDVSPSFPRKASS
jgi:hypothetical protein